MRIRINNKIVAAIVLAVMIVAAPAAVRAADDIVIDNARGVDSRVNYTKLVAFGPWDDRNYNLTLEDLELLAKNEDELVLHIPAFFRVELRRGIPEMLRTGPVQYPRSAPEAFRMKYEGLLIEGVIQRDGGGEVSLEKTVNGEYHVDNGAESAVAINPFDATRVVAGFNGSGGQKMMYSTNGGQTWANATGSAIGSGGVLSSSCCDPTVGFSLDASVVYTSALMSCGGSGCGVSAFRSTDNGETWGGAVSLVSSGCDKNYLHVDRHPSSPYKDYVYQSWHCSNTLKFARSTNMGVSYGSTISFGSDPSGIGSDITSDTAGKVFYVWPSSSNSTIELKTSTDGGATFASGTVTIANTTASFDFPIPAMETRRAWIYASADTDISGGANNNHVYAAWTDSTADSGTASSNHTQIFVSKSTNGGASWTTAIPHATGDVNSVDRFNQWMEVDANGIIHLVYYTTEFTGGDRTKADLAYQYSDDGAATWSVPERVTGTSSANPGDSFEYGDYNGLDIMGTLVMPIYTDNTSTVDVQVADVVNPAANPDFTVQGTNLSQSVCKPGSATGVGITIGQMMSFTNPVTLAWQSPPTGFSGSVVGSPVTPPGSATGTLSLTSGAASGTHNLVIVGTASGSPGHNLDVTVDVVEAVVAGPALTAPSNGASGVSPAPSYTWGAVAGGGTYEIQIATDGGFANIADSTAGLATESWSGNPLAASTLHYWRVRLVNGCGSGPWSGTFSFTTASIACLSFPSSDIPKAVSDGSPASSTIALSDLNITDIDVQLDLDHSWVGDLDINLAAPGGAEVVLLDRPGVPASSTVGCSNDDMVVLFDDGSATDLEAHCAGTTPWYSGAGMPAGSLADFNGNQAAGDWTLTITDNAGGDDGTLQSWSLEICYDSGVVPGGEIFADDFETGAVANWSSSVP